MGFFTPSSTTANRKWTSKRDFLIILYDPVSGQLCEVLRKVSPLPVSILDEPNTELMDTYLPYGGNQESLNHVKVCIRQLPNHWVTDEKLGLHPACCLMS